MDTLVPGMNATHGVLADRLEIAAAMRPDPRHARDQYPATDTFLASASRHNAAVNAVLVPAVRHRLPDGHERARDFIHQSKRFEVALAQVKAKMYGSTYAIRRSWDSIWGDVRQEFEATRLIEHELARELEARPKTSGDADLADRLYDAELHAPTRPHPYIPHQGMRGKVARKVAMRIDRFWDTAEGRMVPEPVKHHDWHKDGRLTQYFLADPHLPEEPPDA